MNLKQNAHLLTAAELKRRGITRYDAEILLAQGVKLPEPREPLARPLPLHPAAKITKPGPVKVMRRGKGGRFCRRYNNKQPRVGAVPEFEQMDSEVSSTNGSETDPWSLSGSSAEIKENITSSPAARRRHFSGVKGFRSPPRGELFGTDDIIDFDTEIPKMEVERSRSRSNGRSGRGYRKMSLTPVSKGSPTEKSTALVSPISNQPGDVKIGDTVPLSAGASSEANADSEGLSTNNGSRRTSLRNSRMRGSQIEQMPRLRKERSLSSPGRGGGRGGRRASSTQDAAAACSSVSELLLDSTNDPLANSGSSTSSGHPMPVLVKEGLSSQDTAPDSSQLKQGVLTGDSSSDAHSSQSEPKISPATSKRNLFDDVFTDMKSYVGDSDSLDSVPLASIRKKRPIFTTSISDSKLPLYETQFTSDLALKIRNTSCSSSNGNGKPRRKREKSMPARFASNCYDSELVPQQDGKLPKITIRLRKSSNDNNASPSKRKKSSDQDSRVTTTTASSSLPSNSDALSQVDNSSVKSEYEIVNHCDEGNNNVVADNNKRKWPSSSNSIGSFQDANTGYHHLPSSESPSRDVQPKRIKIKFGLESVIDLHISPGKRRKVEKVCV